MRLDSTNYLCCPSCTGELLLEIETQTENEVVQGFLKCPKCRKDYRIEDGLPSLMFPEVLDDIDFTQKEWHDKYARQYDQMNREWNRKLMLWAGLWETQAKRQVVNRLELKKDSSVLETGAGTGINLPIIADQIGIQGQLHGMDISAGMLQAARQKMNAKGINIELVQGNASYLPYKTGKFDAVLHAGALNEFIDKKRAIHEMHRVAKPGGKIVIFDEGLAPDKRDTWHGRRILKLAGDQFNHAPPEDLIPKNIEDLKVYWVWQKTHWIIEFRKKRND